jgi:hypothetical protein
MFKVQRLAGVGLVVFVLAATVLAQESRAPIDNSREAIPAAPLVTVTAIANRVRFVSPGAVVQLRLEVYNEAGRKHFDTELHGGNVLDWYLQDGAGERLPAGSYACVLTIKSLSGRLSQRVGIVTVDQHKAVIAPEGSTLSLAQQQTIGPVEGNAAFTALPSTQAAVITAVTHDGADGQVTSSRGALTFRTGDVFAGSDKEQMRITEEGKVGIGTDKPEATLDVAGTVRVSEGVKFADGTTLQAAHGKLSVRDANGATALAPATAGTGTQNRVAKWTETGGAGTLGDTQITENNGSVVIGNSGQTGNIQIFGGAGQDVFAGMGPDINAGPAFNYGYAGGSFGRSAGFFNVRPDASAIAPNPSLRFMTANVERMIVTNTGNVGIGIAAPTYKFQVHDASNRGLRVLTNTAGGTVASFGGLGAFVIDTVSTVGGRFTVQESGNVGIGASSPLAKLDILAGADNDGQFDPKAMAFQYRYGGYRHWIRTRHNATLGSGNAIDFFVNDSATADGSSGPGLGSGSAHVMTLDSGRVGIGGVTTPTEALSVQGKIESLFGGFKFPDATVQTTAAANATYTTVNDTGVQLTTTYPGESAVLHLNLPAGTYLITADIRFRNSANYFNADNSRQIMCRFSGEGDDQGDGGYRHESNIAGLTRLEMSFHTVANISSGGVDVLCRAFSWYGDLHAESRRLTAVKLAGSVSVQ